MLGKLIDFQHLLRGISRRLAYLAPFLVLLGAVVVRYVDPPSLRQLRDYAFDSFQRFAPRPWAPDVLPVRVIDIDEASLRAIGQWPWPRNRVAELIDALSEAGAAVIAFDGIFSEPDRTSPRAILAALKNELGPDLAERLHASAIDNDGVLADAITKSGRVVLGFALDPSGLKEPPRKIHGISFAGDDPNQFVPSTKDGTIRNLEILENAASGMGSIMTDIADVIRYVPLLFHVPGTKELFPSLSIETLRVLQGATTYIVRSSNASGIQSFGVKSGIESIKVGEVIVPTTRQGSVYLYDTGTRKERFVSAIDVLQQKVDKEKLEGHIVLIGSSAAGLKDLRNTPIGSAVPGVEVHAQVVEQILLLWKGAEMAATEGAPAILKEMAAHSFIYRPDSANGAEFIYLIVFGLLLLFLLPRLRARSMAIVGLTSVAIGVAVPWFLFKHEGLLFDPIYPAGTVALMYIIGSAFSFIQTELDRAQIRNAFGMYLAPAVVERLARNPDQLRLGGETRELTIMFTDVRGFTTISEQFDAQGLTRFMNRMLTPMTDLILARFGTIDKYMGDAIMAFWNAPMDEPQHAARACETALLMQARLKDLNTEWRAEAEAEGRRHIEVRIGVGLNSGPASVGNFGSTQRFTYTALSDDVNLASRLEGQCKTYAVDVIIGDKTRRAAPEFAALEIDLIMVKGKTTPERIHALVGTPDVAQSEPFKLLAEAHDKFIEAYRAGRFEEAMELAIAADERTDALGWRQRYYMMMRDRCRELIEEPPSEWNGVYVAKEK